MLIRSGFISNSSSRSYIVYGILISEEEVQKGLNIIDIEREYKNISQNFYNNVEICMDTDSGNYFIYRDCDDKKLTKEDKTNFKNILSEYFSKEQIKKCKYHKCYN